MVFQWILNSLLLSVTKLIEVFWIITVKINLQNCSRTYLGLLQRHKMRSIKAINKMPPATEPAIINVFFWLSCLFPVSEPSPPPSLVPVPSPVAPSEGWCTKWHKTSKKHSQLLLCTRHSIGLKKYILRGIPIIWNKHWEVMEYYILLSRSLKAYRSRPPFISRPSFTLKIDEQSPLTRSNN